MRKAALAIFVQVPLTLLSLIAGVVYIGALIELLERWVGSLANWVWVFAAPFLAPAVLVLPWFDAWAAGGKVSARVFWIWAALMGELVVAGIVVLIPRFGGK